MCSDCRGDYEDPEMTVPDACGKRRKAMTVEYYDSACARCGGEGCVACDWTGTASERDIAVARMARRDYSAARAWTFRLAGLVAGAAVTGIVLAALWAQGVIP